MCMFDFVLSFMIEMLNLKKHVSKHLLIQVLRYGYCKIAGILKCIKINPGEILP